MTTKFINETFAGSFLIIIIIIIIITVCVCCAVCFSTFIFFSCVCFSSLLWINTALRTQVERIRVTMPVERPRAELELDSNRGGFGEYIYSISLYCNARLMSQSDAIVDNKRFKKCLTIVICGLSIDNSWLPKSWTNTGVSDLMSSTEIFQLYISWQTIESQR